MRNDIIIKKIFIFFLTVTLLISAYFCFDVKVLGNNTFYNIYTDWQLPMLLALYLEITYTTVFDTFEFIF